MHKWKRIQIQTGRVRLLLFSRFVTLGKPLLRVIVCRHH